MQEQHGVVRLQHIERHGYIPLTDQPRIRDGVMGGKERAGRDHGGAVAGEAGDAVNTYGFNGFRDGHRRQDGGEVESFPRCKHSREP